MTGALAQRWAPGYITPGARPFENSIEDLALVGVHLAPEQVALGEHAATFRPGWWQKLHCLTFMALPDPMWPHAEAMGLPSFTLDEFGITRPVIVPVVAEVDCSPWETFDEQEPNWRRYPSLLARRRAYNARAGGILIDELSPLRLWHCWPLEECDVALVEEALEEWLGEEWLPYLSWLEVRDNEDTTACDALEESAGVPTDQHQHEYDERGDLVVCRDGESWFEWFSENRMTLDDDGDPYPQPFKGVGGLHHLTEAWTQLVASSQANTMMALQAYPPWEHESVIRTERHYSPWLLSS